MSFRKHRKASSAAGLLCFWHLLMAAACCWRRALRPRPRNWLRRWTITTTRCSRLRVNFTESYPGMGMDRHESGVLLLEKPGRMRWNYAEPPGKVFVLDGKYGWFYTPGDAQVQQIPAKKLDDLRSPLRFLLGHAQLTKELDGLTMTPADDGLFRLRGVPKRDGAAGALAGGDGDRGRHDSRDDAGGAGRLADEFCVHGRGGESGAGGGYVPVYAAGGGAGGGGGASGLSCLPHGRSTDASAGFALKCAVENQSCCPGGPCSRILSTQQRSR